MTQPNETPYKVDVQQPPTQNSPTGSQPTPKQAPADADAFHLGVLRQLLSCPPWDQLDKDTQRKLASLKILSAYHYSLQQRQRLGRLPSDHIVFEILLAGLPQPDPLPIYLRMCQHVNNKSLLPQEIYYFIADEGHAFWAQPLADLQDQQRQASDEDSADEEAPEFDEDYGDPTHPN